MATSKGRNNAPAKSAPGKKSAAPSKSGSASSSSRGSGKATPPARGTGGGSSSRSAAAPSKAPAKSSGSAARGAAAKGASSNNAASKGASAKGAASKGASSNSAASKGAASKGAASKSAVPSRNSNAGKASAAGRTTPAKSIVGSKAAASKNAASKSAARNTSARASKGTASAGDARNDLEKIMQDLLKDIYYAEKKLTKALGKMAKNATNPKLKEAFTTHQAQTEDQVAKLEKAFGVLGMTPKAVRCAAMDGLLEEANEHIEEYEKGAGLDAALIVGAQKVEHYEMAAYGSMRSFARKLGYTEAAAIFESIREQESDTDELLTTLAESVINPKAEEETEDVSDGAKSGGDSGKGNTAGGKSRGGSGRDSEDSDAGEDSSSMASGREGGDDALSSDESGDSSISGMTDGNNREGASETGEAMGY